MMLINMLHLDGTSSVTNYSSYGLLSEKESVKEALWLLILGPHFPCHHVCPHEHLHTSRLAPTFTLHPY